ncbi:putative glycoside hydrolase [Cohnella cholangitidis]|uniref:GTP-binding protein n=1 Tax=Cohnella cholangitidis TaxID=2598458 RepID=A0A7G5BZ96_9BACL|nr:putative glycoside hydrolase [Cohnella cholangitidis]QMV42280.1 GTP-binding protein [Cohnella cholangitidis]
MKKDNIGKQFRLICWTLIVVLSVAGCASDTKRHINGASQSKTLDDRLSQAIKNTKTSKFPKFQIQRHIDDSQTVTLMKATKPVRAIYVSSHVANSSSRMKQLIDLVNQTELNAMVLDVNSGISLSNPVRSGTKNDHVRPALSNKKSALHFRQVIKQLKQQNIYLIARVVTFKNPTLANAVPAWTIKRKDGKVWRDRNGVAWIDPYREEAWEYPIAIAELAARIGFDEIQFDYVRFPENASKVDREVDYANDQGWTKSEAIGKFLHRANLRAHKHGAKVSADVFGMVGSSDDDMGIGQSWDSIAREVDVISPMIYPSHYSEGMWGIEHPDLSPGPIVTKALKDALKHNRRLNQKGIATAKVRPWLQGFTAGWVHPHQRYGENQIREQIAPRAMPVYILT